MGVRLVGSSWVLRWEEGGQALGDVVHVGGDLLHLLEVLSLADQPLCLEFVWEGQRASAWEPNQPASMLLNLSKVIGDEMVKRFLLGLKLASTAQLGTRTWTWSGTRTEPLETTENMFRGSILQK